MEPLFPEDMENAVLLGRILTAEGPSPVLVRRGRIADISSDFATVADLLAGLAPGEALPQGRDLGPTADNDFSAAWRDGGLSLLAPVDLQCIKAAGVTFAVSALERVIEERARGNASQAAQFRDKIRERIGGELATVRPGSAEAEALKSMLIAEGMWSQYLEVAIGPHAEVFTKAPILSAVGWGADIGIRADSSWNNPEPEIVVVCDPQGRIRGVTLGNDVNLRDIEGRSALLLGKAKDNNASCAIGPFIRLFDDHFGIDDVRGAQVRLLVEGEADGFSLEGVSNMREISRDPLDLVAQTFGAHHQYPDGFMLYLGTMFSPIKDRGEAGKGFTHQLGDRVTIASERLGALVNIVDRSDRIAPWTFGVRALYEVIRQRAAPTAR